MPNYSDGKIYAIRSYQTDQVYIGSTTQNLPKRFHEHKQSYQAYLKTQKKYISSFEMLKYDDCYIELIKKCPCESREELLREEGMKIREMNCVNKKIEGRTHKEYFDDNREEHNEKMKEYYKDPEKRDMQKKWNSEVVICNSCNSEMNKGSWLKHCQSIKHMGRIAAPSLKEGENAGWRPKFIRNQVNPTKVTYRTKNAFIVYSAMRSKKYK